MKCLINLNGEKNDKFIMTPKRNINTAFENPNKLKKKNEIPIAPLKNNKPKPEPKVNEILKNPWIPKNINTNSKLSKKVTNENQLKKVPTTCKKMSTKSCMNYFNSSTNYMRSKNPETKEEDVSMESLFDANINIFIKSRINSSTDIIKKSENIDKAVKDANDNFKYELLALPNKIGICKTKTEYNKYLEIYQNNQEYYFSKLDDVKNNPTELDDFKTNLTNLEQWFLNIISFKSKFENRLESWLLNEFFKVDKKRNKQCMNELIEYLNPININYISSQYYLDLDMTKYCTNKGLIL